MERQESYFMFLVCALITKERPVGARNVAGIPLSTKMQNIKIVVVL